MVRLSGLYPVIPNSSTPWRHVVDLFVFCVILASFLDWIFLSVTVVIPRPEPSLSVNMQVGRKILGAKIEIVNCLLVVYTCKWRFKMFLRKLYCSIVTKAALVWVINGSTSDSESLDTVRDWMAPKNVTSHYREPFNLLQPMFCASYFSSHISYLCLRLYRLPTFWSKGWRVQNRWR